MTQTLLKVAADFETSLNAQVTAGDTTATLSSIEDTAGVDLANGLYGFTIDGDNQYKEYIIATLTDTALTGVYSISPQGVATSGFSTYHRRGASVVVTDWASLSRITNVLDGTTDFDASTHLGYDAAPAGLTGNEFATVAYVLGVVSGGTVAFDQQVIGNQTAGENLTALNLVYFKTSDQRWWKCDADTSSTVIGVRLGIALSTQTTGNALSIAITGPVTTSGLTAGAKYYASQTAGGITDTAPSAPAFPAFIGWALSTTRLMLAPNPTVDQFSGVSATPSVNNKFLDQASASAGATDQSQATQNGTTPAGQADATTRSNKVAQSFIPTKTIIKSVNLNKQANTGTFTGTVTVSIQSNSAGSPDGVALATKTIPNLNYLAYSNGDFLCIFAAECTVVPGNLYWIVIETSTSDNSNCINLGTNTAGGYSSGSVKAKNTTDGWFAISTIDLYFKVNEGFNGKEILGNSTGFVPAPAIKLGAVSGLMTMNGTTAVTVANTLGRVPLLIKATYLFGSSTAGAQSTGIYNVATAAYAFMSANYNEATSGDQTTATDGIVQTAFGTTSFGRKLTVNAVDENVISLVSSGADTSVILYEVIG